LIGQQKAALTLYTSRRIKAEEVNRWGLVDILAPQDNLRASAPAPATEIAEAAPLAVEATRNDP
jgi:enoyl-CoA hydratase/carnithine racemase